MYIAIRKNEEDGKMTIIRSFPEEANIGTIEEICMEDALKQKGFRVFIAKIVCEAKVEVTATIDRDPKVF